MKTERNNSIWKLSWRLQFADICLWLYIAQRVAGWSRDSNIQLNDATVNYYWNTISVEIEYDKLFLRSRG